MTEKYTTEIDPVTGFPKEVKPLDPDRASKLTERQSRSELLKASLASETGQAVLLKIQEHLMKRVSHLMLNDPEAKVLIKLLSDMKVTTDFGEVAVKGIMKMVGKK